MIVFSLGPQKAGELLSLLVSAMADLFLPDLRVEVSADNDAWTVRSQLLSNDDYQAGAAPAHRGGMAIGSALGAWVPFLPRPVALRLTATSAVTITQRLVAQSTGSAWPGVGYKPRARVANGVIEILFVSGQARNHPIALEPVSISTFLAKPT